MCTELQEFDLKCQGAYRLAEGWRASPELQAVWHLEDVIRVYNEVFPQPIAAYEQHCKSGTLPGKFTLAAVLEYLRRLAFYGNLLLKIASEKPASDFEVGGAAELRRQVAVAQEILEEENFASDMSFRTFSEN